VSQNHLLELAGGSHFGIPTVKIDRMTVGGTA
jgi:hypothetical protein